MMKRTVIAFGMLGTLGMIFSAGCVVAQPPGKGRVMHLQEPSTKRWYWLYLPEDYVKSGGNAEASASGSAPGASNAALGDKKSWPMVMTLHGMRPFDSEAAQIREWQEEADRYGFVVCAPTLRYSDLYGQFPVKRVDATLEKDAASVLAIMDDIFSRTDADPNQVLVTSWSMGGYMAHFLVNRYPERFKAVAVKESNFSPTILDVSQVSKYQNMPIEITYTQNDFSQVRKESLEAINWYIQNGFEVKYGVVKALGHERTPEVPAAFFAQVCGVEAKAPPVKLARIQGMELPQQAQQTMAANGRESPQTVPSSAPSPRPAVGAINFAPAKPVPPAPGAPTANPPTTAERTGSGVPAAPRTLAMNPSPSPTGRWSSAQNSRIPAPRPTEPLSGSSGIAEPRLASTHRPRASQDAAKVDPTPIAPVTSAAPAKNVVPVPARSLPNETAVIPTTVRSSTNPTLPTSAEAGPVRVRLSTTIGVSPVPVSYAAIVPSDILEGASILWTDNGEPISNAVSGQRIINAVGDHVLEVLVITPENKSYRAAMNVTVLEKLSRTRGS